MFLCFETGPAFKQLERRCVCMKHMVRGPPSSSLPGSLPGPLPTRSPPQRFGPSSKSLIPVFMQILPPVPSPLDVRFSILVDEISF